MLILTDSGEDFMIGSEIRHTDRWHFSGSITPAGLGVLVQSVCKTWMTGLELPAEPSPKVMVNTSRTSAAAYAERD
jgi:hypothetical protein